MRRLFLYTILLTGAVTAGYMAGKVALATVDGGLRMFAEWQKWEHQCELDAMTLLHEGELEFMALEHKLTTELEMNKANWRAMTADMLLTTLIDGMLRLNEGEEPLRTLNRER